MPTRFCRPRLLQQLRLALRVRHYSPRTEEAYVAWVRRYVRFHGMRHPGNLGRDEIRQFLTALADRARLSASSQTQALSALIFLYREVLDADPGAIGDIARARQPERLPVVLGREEVRALLDRQVDQVPHGLHELCRRRDHLSDSVALFAAIAVEAFINYYGLVRLGEDQFNRHFERLPIHRKLEPLVLVCDGVELEVQDPINRALRNVVERRNRLAHPKAKQVSPDQPPEERVKEAIPEARDSVDAMKAFFQEFVGLVPGSRHMIPGRRVA